MNDSETNALNVMAQFGAMVADTATVLADEKGLTMDQAVTVAHAAVLMLVNGTLNNMKG